MKNKWAKGKTISAYANGLISKNEAYIRNGNKTWLLKFNVGSNEWESPNKKSEDRIEEEFAEEDSFEDTEEQDDHQEETKEDLISNIKENLIRNKNADFKLSTNFIKKQFLNGTLKKVRRYVRRLENIPSISKEVSKLKKNFKFTNKKVVSKLFDKVAKSGSREDLEEIFEKLLA